MRTLAYNLTIMALVGASATPQAMPLSAATGTEMQAQPSGGAVHFLS